ncbi:MAG: 50S ribosomal protein L32e [Candidatus Thermoplasmatota archaeon]|nr:50S ribosomal protein L32e [Candidatus Thermoplasmatota archaeon]
MGEEEVKIVEEGEYVPKKKPALDEGVKKLLSMRKKPKFVRQQWYQYKRLDKKWVSPRGMHSKLRKGRRYRTLRVKIGYGAPKKVKGLHPSGFEEVMVYNVDDMKGLNPEREAVRISARIGKKKRIGIIEKADELGLRVLNRGV